MNTAQQKDNYIKEIREAASHILKGWEMLQNVRKHWVIEDLGNVLTDADLAGTQHEGLTLLQLQNVVQGLYTIFETYVEPQQQHLYAIEIELNSED